MRILLEGKNQVIDVPDGATTDQIEMEANKYYTPEEISDPMRISVKKNSRDMEFQDASSVSLGEEPVTMPTTFHERQDYRIRKGRASVDTGKAFADVMDGKRSYEDAQKFYTDTMSSFTPDNDKKYQASNIFESMVGMTTELAPYMLDSGVQGFKYGEILGAGFAGIALIGGSAGPQALVPEEAITLPIAYGSGKMIGQAYGSWENASKVEGGSIYQAIRENGGDHETAVAWAKPAGYVIGAIELFQLEKIFKPFLPSISKKTLVDFIKTAAKKQSSSLSQKIAKSGLAFAKESAIFTGIQTAEELTQQGVSTVAEVGAAIVKDMADSEGYGGPSEEEIKNEFAETLKSSLLGFPLLGLPANTHALMVAHGKEVLANRVLTQRAVSALETDLAPHIEEATKFGTYPEYFAALDPKIDDKFAGNYGFDNRVLFSEGVWNASRWVKQEGKIIDQLAGEKDTSEEEMANIALKESKTAEEITNRDALQSAIDRSTKLAESLGVKIDSIEQVDEEMLLDPDDAMDMQAIIQHGYTEQEVRDAIKDGKRFIVTGEHTISGEVGGPKRSSVRFFRGATEQDAYHEIVAHAVESQGGLPGWKGTPEEHAKYLEEVLARNEEEAIIELTRQGSRVGLDISENLGDSTQLAIRTRDGTEIDIPSEMNKIQEAKDSKAVKDAWQAIYDQAKKITASKMIEVKGGKLEGVVTIHLTKNCQRVNFIKIFKRMGLLPQSYREVSCYASKSSSGACYKDRFQYAKRTKTHGAKVQQENSISEKPIELATKADIRKMLSDPKNQKLIKDSTMVRLGQSGDDSHALYLGLVEELLKVSKELGVRPKEKYVFVTSSYAPTTAEMYQRLAPYKDLFVIHISESGYFGYQEILNRFNEFAKANNSGLNVKMRVITNKDLISAAENKEDIAEAGPMETKEEEFLFQIIDEYKLNNIILETPFHNDFHSGRSQETGKYENVCCQTGKCKSCGVSCLIKQGPSKPVMIGTKGTQYAIRKVSSKGKEDIFDINTTSVSHYDNLFGTRGNEIDNVKDITQKEYYAQVKDQYGEVVYMTPDEYLGQIKYAPPSPESQKYLKSKIKKGEKIPIGFLDYSGEGPIDQEGRNRAYLSKEMGIERIPVLMVAKSKLQLEELTSRYKYYPEGQLAIRTVKGQIRETTGLVDSSALIKESEALKRLMSEKERISAELTKKLGAEEKKLLEGAIKQFLRYEKTETKLKEKITVEEFNREADKVLQGMKDELKKKFVQYANENLSKEDRGAFLTSAVGINTEAQLEKQMQRVNELAEKSEKKKIIRNIAHQVKRIEKSKSISIDYVNKIMEFINDYEIKGHTARTMDRLKATKDFIEKETAAGRNVELPSYVYEALEILGRKPLNELGIPDLQNINEKIRVAADLGKVKLRSRKAADKLMKARDIIAIKADSKAINSKKIKEGNAISGKLSKVEEFLNGIKKAINIAQMKDLVLTPMDAVFDYLDNSKGYLGANYRIFKRRIDVAHSVYLAEKNEIKVRVDEKANELNLNEDNMERIGLYAAKVQEGGTEKLLNFFTQEQIDSVVLTKEEMEYYKFLRKELDTLRPRIERIMREVYNEPLGNVENYFPFLTDFDAMSEKEIKDNFGKNVITLDLNAAPLKKNVEMGFTKKRSGPGKQRIKINAAEVFGSHIDNALYLINVGRETKYLGELANTVEYGESVGDVGQEIVREWVDLLARKGMTQGQRVKALDIVRNYTGIVGLGFKLGSTLVQVTSLMDGAALIGGHAFNGFKDILIDSNWRRFVIDNMPELKNRIGDDEAFTDFKKDNWTRKLSEAAFWGLKSVDRLAASGVAAGAYAKYMEDNNLQIDLDNPNPDAIIYAQRMLRRTQSSSNYKDMPLAISKGKLTGNISVDKFLLQFQSFMLNRWSLVRHDLWRAGIKGTNKKQAVSIAMWLIAANYAELGVRRWTKEMIASLTGQMPPEDDEDKDFEKGVGQILQNIPFIGSIYYAMLYGDLPIPALSMGKKVLSKSGNVYKAMISEDGEDVGKKWLDLFLNVTPGGQQFTGITKEQ